MISAELLQKKEQLQQQIKDFDRVFYEWTNENIIPELNEKFNTQFNMRLRFDIEDDYVRSTGQRVSQKDYTIEGELLTAKNRGGYSFYMSCYHEAEFHFSPSMGSAHSNEIDKYAQFLKELANFAAQAKEIDKFIWNHPGLNAKAEEKFQLRIALNDIENEIRTNDSKVKIDYINKTFEENKGTFKTSGIRNRNGRYVSTDFISFKKFIGNEVYLKDSKNATVICTVDEVYKALGGK